MKALVVGGTGPTGPFIVNGLVERGYEVTIFTVGPTKFPKYRPNSNIFTATRTFGKPLMRRWVSGPSIWPW